MFAAQPFARDLRLTNSRNRISSLTISDRIVKSLGSIDFHFSSTRQRPSLRFASFSNSPQRNPNWLTRRNGFTMRSNVYEMASRKKINYERITKLRVIGRWWLASFVYKFSPRWYLFFFCARDQSYSALLFFIFDASDISIHSIIPRSNRIKFRWIDFFQ